MRYKAVIFDLDGTLLDTLADLANSGNKVLEQLGFDPHPTEAYRYFVGDGMASLVERILPEHHRTPAVLAQAIEYFKQDYARNWAVETKMYPGVAEMLDELTLMGVKICILSNKPDGFTRVCVDSLLPKWHFEPVLGQRDQVPKKPDPAGALEIIEELAAEAMEASEILYVGDTAVDMQTAVGAQLDSVGVLWGFRDIEELQQNGAKYLVNHPGEIIDIIRC
ncbi:HAD family hydrolase [Desulfogranum marinum]|uniref:HAD family hydrolase n=1 Tax=Desulfogranum marinum TaxID=453220 RepID=UPI001963D3E3|nr:HAD family hydrolase [Desulfogranum marinum]MBM9512545.1 HAD family hydrolase [Desulfogranum marinum]